MRIGFVELVLLLFIASITVGPNVALFADRWLRRAQRTSAAAARRKAQLEAQARDLLAQMGLSERAGHYPHQLSGGMLQRIMIGIATSMKPSLLIADEPTTAIDAITQFEILDELLRIKQEHQTAMVFISHDLNAISRVADRIVVLNQGLVVDQGDFHHILHHATDSYTKLLVEKRTDVMRRYSQVLGGKERVYA